MVWVLIAIGSVVAVSAVVVVIGAMLPKEHSVSRMAHYNRSPADIWEVITDYAGQVAWRSDLLRVERLPNRGGREVWQETDKRGQALDFETVESNSPRHLVRRIANENLQFGGAWTLDISDFGEVTSVTITENGEVYNPVFRFISRFIIGQTATIDGYLRDLGTKLGVDVDVTGV